MTKDNTHDHEKRLDESRQYWSGVAVSFDNEPDHGLHSPVVREAWTQLLRTVLPATYVTLLDVGCGTGSLSLVLAGLGHQVTGIDLSPAMISLAEAKAAASTDPVTFQIMDAAVPESSLRRYDGIVCRHLPNLWGGLVADEVIAILVHPAQRAADGWDASRARFQAVCAACGWFRQSGVFASRPPAGNASRWVLR